MTTIVTVPPDPDPDNNGEENATPHIYQPSGSENTDAEAVRDALLRKPPSLPTVKAKEVEHLNENEMVSLADNRARMNSSVPQDSATASNEIKRTEAEIIRLESEKRDLSKRLASEPDEERSYRNTDTHGIAIPVIFSKSGAAIGLSVIAMMAITATFLGIEFNFAQTAVSLSKLKLGQTLAGSRGLIFPVTFCSFVAFTFWSYAEEARVHWTTLFLARLAVAFAFVSVPVTGFIIGCLHLPSGASFGWTMILLPLLTSLLVLSTVGLKYATVWAAKFAFPYEMIASEKWQKMKDQLTAVEVALVVARKDHNQAEELQDRVEAIVGEFIGRTRGVWSGIQVQKQKLDKRKEALRQRLLAEANEKLLDME